MQRIYSSQNKLEKEQIEELTLSNFKNFYKPIVKNKKQLVLMSR